MPYCSRCRRDVCKPCAIKPGLCDQRYVTLARDDELLRRSHVRRLAIATRALELPRREIPNWMADVIYGYGGDIFWSGGKLFKLDNVDIDTVFNDDGSFRWISDFVRFAERWPAQTPQQRLLPRLRLIDLAFRISNPERARLIAK